MGAIENDAGSVSRLSPYFQLLLPAHVMYIAIVFALPQMIYLALALEIVLAYKRHQLQEQKDPS